MPDEDPTGFRIVGEQPPIPRWNCGKTLSSERPRIAACSNPLQVRIAQLNGKGGSVPRRAVYRVQQGAGDGSCARMTDPRIVPRLRLDISGVK
jgi:hypothetical protein